MVEVIGEKIILENNDEIRLYYTEKGIVKAYVSDERIQSLMYNDKEKTHELAHDYFQYYDIPVEINKKGKKYLVLGGGMFSYPHHFLQKYKDKIIDIVEINQESIEVAKKHFYLDKLINNDNYNKRMNIFIEDAIKYIHKNKNKYDFILIDLFSGREMIEKIYDRIHMKKLFKQLSKKGIIAINYIISYQNIHTYREQIKKIVKDIKYHKIIANEICFDYERQKGNVLILLSNNNIKIPNIYDYIDMNYIINDVK